jgi:RHH-type proline utilization regulon transcriptional repressor/proline dehydrogenase/delta 1-pyrroline-5-carboxylate dehydrogenase
MLRLAEPQDLGSYGSESNYYFYEPKGVAVVIAPWNFPFAISCGMAAAATVTGCPVVYCLNQRPWSGIISEIFRAVGLPSGVHQFRRAP